MAAKGGGPAGPFSDRLLEQLGEQSAEPSLLRTAIKPGATAFCQRSQARIGVVRLIADCSSTRLRPAQKRGSQGFGVPLVSAVCATAPRCG